MLQSQRRSFGMGEAGEHGTDRHETKPILLLSVACQYVPHTMLDQAISTPEDIVLQSAWWLTTVSGVDATVGMCLFGRLKLVRKGNGYF